MITPKYRKLFEMSSSYIKDGKLIKYRWDNDDPNHIDSLLHVKSVNQDLVNDDIVIAYLALRGNLVIETKGKIKLHNFDENFLDIARKNDFPHGYFLY